MKSTVFVLASLAALSASATWTLSTENVPSGCTHVITDGNWKIGVTKIEEGNWRLGRVWSGGNGSTYIEGSGDLDLTGVEADCGVVLKSSNNGALEKNSNITSVIFPDSLEIMLGNTVASCGNITNIVVGSGIKSLGQQCFAYCTSLKTIALPEGCLGLTTLDHSVFRGCKVLTTPLDFSKATFTEIPTYALVDLEKVIDIKLPETLTTIGKEAMRYNKRARVVWFYGPPPTSIGDTALDPKGGSSGWVLVAGKKHAAEWKGSEHLLPFEGTEAATAKAAAESLGLTGVKPIGKWTYQAGGYTHWVVEELPKGLTIYIM